MHRGADDRMVSRMIGIFDSGLGGLTVVSHLKALAPQADLLYLGDRARAPYGPREPAEVGAFSREITARLLSEGADVIVVACNTASAAALHELRAEFPGVAFVGMEPALKPAASKTASGIVGVVATSGTLNGPLYESVVDRFGFGVQIIEAARPDWVEIVESGGIGTNESMTAVEAGLNPLLDAGADHIVLGCTHFPLLRDEMVAVIDGRAELIDPGPAVARQTVRVAQELCGLDGDGGISVTLTGSDTGAQSILDRLGLSNASVAVTSALR
jgi:glutamate racemase